MSGSSPEWIDMVRTGLAPETRERSYDTPGLMSKVLDRITIQTPALELIDEHLVQVANGHIERLITKAQEWKEMLEGRGVDGHIIDLVCAMADEGG